MLNPKLLNPETLADPLTELLLPLKGPPLQRWPPRRRQARAQASPSFQSVGLRGLELRTGPLGVFLRGVGLQILEGLRIYGAYAGGI